MSSDLLFSSAKVFFLTRATVANHFNCKNFSANLPRLWRWKYESWWIVALIVIEFSCITYLGSGFDLFVRGGTEHFLTTTLFLSKIDNFFAVSSWMSILGRYLSCRKRRRRKMENLSKERKKEGLKSLKSNYLKLNHYKLLAPVLSLLRKAKPVLRIFWGSWNSILKILIVKCQYRIPRRPICQVWSAYSKNALVYSKKAILI